MVNMQQTLNKIKKSKVQNKNPYQNPVITDRATSAEVNNLEELVLQIN